jgi:mRNA interferase MazF
MEKDFDQWNGVKKELQFRKSIPFFEEREVWWCSMGANVGWEQDGKGASFSRPVLILRKFVIPNKKDPTHPLAGMFWAVPLTTQNRKGFFYRPVHFKLNQEMVTRIAILSQIRLFDSKRLEEKMGTISEKNCADIKKIITKIIQ